MESPSGSSNPEIVEMMDTPLILQVDHDIPEDDLDPHCCIYRVPRRLRERNQEAYTPQLASIGPLHHGQKELANMEKQKRRYLQKFQQRLMATSCPPDVLHCFKLFIRDNETEIRSCYAEFPSNEDIKFESSHVFVEMILQDSVFLIELFLRNFEEEKNDFLLNKQWLAKGLWRDLILLENQIPYFVISGLYRLAFSTTNNNSSPPFLKLVCSYMKLDPQVIPNEKEIKHLTDLERQRLVKKVVQKVKDGAKDPSNFSKQYTENLFSASALLAAGVNFQPCNNYRTETCLLDLEFKNGLFRIPTITFLQSSEVYFRNVMALEQCHYQDEAFVCAYIDFMDYLISSEEDVRLLAREGIVVNTLGSSAAVIDMISKLRQGIVQVPLYYRRIGRDLNRFHDSFLNRSLGNLKHVYFNNLWRGTATIAALIVVLLTVVQTGLAILDRVKPTG